MVQTFSTDGGTIPTDGRMIMGTDGTNCQFISCNSSGELNVNMGAAAATGLLKLEDAAHASGDAGVQCLTVRKNTAAATSGADGDYQPLISDTDGRLHCNAVLSAGTAEIGKLAAGTAEIGKLAAGTAVIGHVIADASTAMIGNVNQGATITSGSVAMVATTSTLIIAAAATRKQLIVRNRSNTAAETVRVGPTAATTAMFTLQPTKIGTTDVMNQPLVLEGFTGALYGYSESGTPTIEYIEILT